MDCLGKNVRFINTYVPPKTSDKQFSDLIYILGKLISVPHSIIITGDFNLPNLNWSNNESETKHIFKEFITNASLIQHIYFPTRSSNILDLLITDNSSLISNLTSLPPFLTSDHD